MESDTRPLQNDDYRASRLSFAESVHGDTGSPVSQNGYSLESTSISSRLSKDTVVVVDDVQLVVPPTSRSGGGEDGPAFASGGDGAVPEVGFSSSAVLNFSNGSATRLTTNGPGGTVLATTSMNKYKVEPGVNSEGYSMAWQNISYTVPVSRLPWKRDRKVLLQSITGHVDKGGIMALMGPSGSGKTTLLDILADRVSSGEIMGEILINGIPRDPIDFRTYSCYVDVNDAFYEIFTVKETMHFTANLCFPSSLTYAEKSKKVRSVLTKVGLESCKHTRIGGELFRGLSTGQKRRLSIALELLKEPWILFLDEPLSGLDGAAAANIMKILTNLADSGKTVVFSVHQPPSRVWNTFSSLTLLSGGLLLYAGPVGEAIPMLTTASGQGIPENCNPADYMLDLVNNDFKGHVKIDKLNDVYLSSQLHRDIFDTIKFERERALIFLADNPEYLKDNRRRRFRAGFHTQIRYLTSRALWNNILHPGLYWSRIVIYILLDLVIASMFTRSIDIKDEYKAGMIFFVQSYLVIMTVAALPYLILARPVFCKERANGLVSVTPYVLSTLIAMIPGVMLATLISALLIFVITGLESFGWFFYILFCTLLCAESIMNLVASLTNQFIVGLAIGAGIYGIFMINAGFLLPSHAIPEEWFTGWRVFHHVAFHKYSLRSLMHNEFSHPKYFINDTLHCGGQALPGDLVPDVNGSGSVGDAHRFTTQHPSFGHASLPRHDQNESAVSVPRCSPILERYKWQDESPLSDTFFILLYTALIQMVLLMVTYFKHTGRR